VWRCPDCQKKVPDDFDVCWRCGTDRSGVADPAFRLAAAEGAAVRREEVERKLKSRRHRRGPRPFQFTIATLLFVQAIASILLGIWKGLGLAEFMLVVFIGGSITLVIAATVRIAGRRIVDSSVLIPGDAVAARALRTAVIGLFVCPAFLHLYSLWTLVGLSISGQPTSSSGDRKYYAALVIDVLVCGVFGCYLTMAFLLGRPR